MKNRHISDAGVSFENIVCSVYQDMGWRTHFLHMAANYRLILIRVCTHCIKWVKIKTTVCVLSKN